MPWDREWTFLVRVAPGKNCTDPLRRQTTLTPAFSLVNRDSNGFQACCAGWDLCPTANLGTNLTQGGASRHASRALGMRIWNRIPDALYLESDSRCAFSRGGVCGRMIV